MKTCTVETCTKPLLARGWCAMHYQRWYTKGSPGDASPLRIAGTPGATSKTCRTCKQEKPVADFYPDTRNADGRGSSCRACLAPGHRDRALRRKYGITQDDFDRMAAEQGGRCPVCQEQPSKLVVDHCHVSGQIRALLCDRCNRLLGVAQDRPDLLEGALAFLQEHPTARP